MEKVKIGVYVREEGYPTYDASRILLFQVASPNDSFEKLRDRYAPHYTHIPAMTLCGKPDSDGIDIVVMSSDPFLSWMVLEFVEEGIKKFVKQIGQDDPNIYWRLNETSILFREYFGHLNFSEISNYCFVFEATAEEIKMVRNIVNVT